MKIAYLILAHNTPKHLQRLIAALSSSSSSFFIHLDKKSDFDAFRGIDGDNIHFAKVRVPVFWGDFSQVEAVLILLRAALADRCCFDRFVLLSGADYPLRSTTYIENFFKSNASREFIDLLPMPSDGAGKPISRLASYKLRAGDRAISKVMRRLLMEAGVLPKERDYKTYLRDLAPYGGSAWWAISREACNYIQTFVKANIEVVDFFRNTHCPDESFFHTILGNSPLNSKIVRSLTYADWRARGASPAYINDEHLAFFQSTSSFAPDGGLGRGEMLFARKFTDESGDLVTRIDRTRDAK